MTISVREEDQNWLVTLCTGTNPDRSQFEPLIRQHWSEIAVNQDVQKLDVKWEFYAETARRGYMWMIVVRDDAKMVGYFLYMLSPIPHYQRIKQATEDSHFILPEYRAQGYGTAMLVCAEQSALNRGAQIMKVRTKVHRDNSDFWEGRKFERVEYVYQKVLRRE